MTTHPVADRPYPGSVGRRGARVAARARVIAAAWALAAAAAGLAVPSTVAAHGTESHAPAPPSRTAASDAPAPAPAKAGKTTASAKAGKTAASDAAARRAADATLARLRSDAALKRDTASTDAEVRHEAEHESVTKAIARFDRLPAARKRAIRRGLLGQDPASRVKARAAAAADDPSVVGRWSSGTFPMPDYAIHAVLLRGGRVLLFSMGSRHGVGPGSPGNTGQGLENDGQATIWDPSLGTGPQAFKAVDPPPIPLDDPQGRPGSAVARPAPLFCAGQVQLADGRVLVAGGNLEAGNGGYGLKILFLFDPRTDAWVREPDLYRNRWYPTLTRLPSGRVAILGGQDEAGKSVASFELYPNEATGVAGVDAGAPLTGLTTTESPSLRDNGMYPHAMVLPSGRLASSSWGAGPMALFEPTTGRWVTRTTTTLALNGSYPTAFPRPGNQFGTTELIQTGGLLPALFPWLQPRLTGNSWAIEPERETAWREQPALNVPRRNTTAVLLPDGSAVAVGGGLVDLRFPLGSNGRPNMGLEQRRVELWDPATNRWTLGPAEVVPRGYHSIGLLLADGRVLSAGDDFTATILDTDRSDDFDSLYQLYYPPYLNRGPRPAIDAAPASAGYGGSIELRATAAAGRRITRATLVAPGSVTHAIDMNQRVLELPVRDEGDGRYSVTAPVTSAAAPPGDYMLFVLDDDGVPSVAAWVRIRPDFPGQGTPTLTPLPGEDYPGTPGPGPSPAPTPPATTPQTVDRAAAEAQLKAFIKRSNASALDGMKRLAAKCSAPKKAAKTKAARAAAAKRLERCRARVLER